MKSDSEQLKLYYFENFSLLVSTSKGLVRIHCPFKANCITSIDTINAGDRIVVISVHVSQDKKLLYLINGKKYCYYYFEILTSG